MKVIPLPTQNNDETLYFTPEQYEKFVEFNLNLKQSISPEEAKHYRNEIEAIILKSKRVFGLVGC